MAKAVKLPMDISDLLNLTPALINFIGHYISNNFDETIAFKKAFPAKLKGLSGPEIRLEALSLLNNREVKLAVQRYTESVIAPHRDKLEMQIMEVLRQRSFYDPLDFFHEDGSPRKLSDIDKQKRVVLDNIMNDAKGGRGERDLLNYKLADRMQAIKALNEIINKVDELAVTDNGVTDESRKRIQDVMSGAMLALKANKKSEKKEKKAEETVEATDVEFEEVEETVEQPKEPLQIEQPNVDNHPLVIKALAIANQQTGGIDAENHPMVKNARKVAMSIKKG
jgi:hypothetical protein